MHQKKLSPWISHERSHVFQTSLQLVYYLKDPLPHCRTDLLTGPRGPGAQGPRGPAFGRFTTRSVASGSKPPMVNHRMVMRRMKNYINPIGSLIWSFIISNWLYYNLNAFNWLVFLRPERNRSSHEITPQSSSKNRHEKWGNSKAESNGESKAWWCQPLIDKPKRLFIWGRYHFSSLLYSCLEEPPQLINQGWHKSGVDIT